MKGSGCQCSNIPSYVKIIKVGNSEVGIVDLMKILRQTYFKRIENESVLREELVRQVKEKNYISEDREDLSAEALLREYRRYAESRVPADKTQREEMKREPKKLRLI